MASVDVGGTTDNNETFEQIERRNKLTDDDGADSSDS